MPILPSLVAAVGQSMLADRGMACISQKAQIPRSAVVSFGAASQKTTWLSNIVESEKHI